MLNGIVNILFSMKIKIYKNGKIRTFSGYVVNIIMKVVQKFLHSGQTAGAVDK